MQAIKAANELSRNEKSRSLWMKFGIRIIFVDATGMLSHDQLHYLDWFLKTVRENCEEPFGGLRIILCGDVLSLPPIVHQKKALYGYLQPQRHPLFVFEALTFWRIGMVLALFQNKRQEICKSSFVRILNAVRDGAHLDAADLHMMNSVWGGEVDMKCALGVIFKTLDQLDKKLTDFDLRCNPLHVDDFHQHSTSGFFLTRPPIVIQHRKLKNVDYGALYSAISRATDDTQLELFKHTPLGIRVIIN